jgi:hypothetical protein
MAGELINKLDPVLNEELNLDWVLADLVNGLSEEAVDAIKAMDSPKGMYGFHHGWGTGLRNGYGLWGDNPLTAWFRKELGVVHGDDISGIIMEGLWHKVHDVPYDPTPTVERFREHWARYGVNLDQTPMEK